MKFYRIIPVLLVPLILTSCQNSAKVDESKGKVSIKMDSLANPGKEYKLKINFDDKYFTTDVSEYNSDLAMLSFASSYASTTKESADEFFSKMFFVDHKDYGYEQITKDTVGYYISHKAIDDYDIIAVSIRGFDYKEEWANNFEMGEVGDHLGFSLRTAEIYDELLNYVTTYSTNDLTPRFWISGYSRGGAIANSLANKLVKEDNNISENDIFAYTFEAPNCLATENIVECKGVFNHVNSCDLVATIPPEKYGLSKCGQNIEIYNDQFADWLLELDKDIVIPTFTPKENKGYTNQKEFIEHVMDLVLTELDEDNQEGSLESREAYCTNYQPHISYLFELFFSLPQETVEHLLARLQSMGFADRLSFVLTDGIYNIIAPVLEADSIQFDETKLKDATNKITAFLLTHRELVSEFFYTISLEIKPDMENNIKHVLLMHYPEMTYVLLKNQNLNL